MRFSLLTMFLVLPAFAVAYGLAIVWESGSLGHPRFARDMIAIDIVRRQCYRAEIEYGSSIPGEAFNAQLSGTLDRGHPAEAVLIANVDIQNDRWGRPFRVTRGSHVSLDDEEIGVFSLGEDGISHSDGNDPDDLNSWNQECYRYYSHQAAAHRRRACVIRAFFLMPFVIGFACVLLACAGARQRRMRTFIQSQPSSRWAR